MMKEEEERERTTKILNERIEIHDDSKKAAQEKLHNFCDGLRARIDEFEINVGRELEEKFTAEDNRLQTALGGLSSDGDDDGGGDFSKAIQRAKAELLVMQSYDVVEHGFDEGPLEKRRKLEGISGLDLASLCELKVERRIVPETFGEMKPTSLVPLFTEGCRLMLSFTLFNEDKVDVLKGFVPVFKVEVKVWEKSNEESTSRTLTRKITFESSDEPICLRGLFTASTEYYLRMRILYQGMSTQWSDEAEFTTPGEIKGCFVWKECPDDIDKSRKYSVDVENPRIATKIGGRNGYYISYCTIIGNTPLLLNAVTSWNIKVLKSRNNNGSDIYIGVAPSDINQNEKDNYNKCGWYFNCGNSTLWSGPPRNYNDKEYGPRKEWGEYVRTGDIVGVVMDTANGELSFIVDGVNLGVAFAGIPLDKPLVPCVILCIKGDSVELVI